MDEVTLRIKAHKSVLNGIVSDITQDEAVSSVEVISSGSINCGERQIQKSYRIALKDICERYGIKEGDAIEVFIKKAEH